MEKRRDGKEVEAGTRRERRIIDGGGSVSRWWRRVLVVLAVVMVENTVENWGNELARKLRG